ncbi:hypothetical protein B6S12_03980, partial [Helicobacter valdiviensis]
GGGGHLASNGKTYHYKKEFLLVSGTPFVNSLFDGVREFFIEMETYTQQNVSFPRTTSFIYLLDNSNPSYSPLRFPLNTPTKLIATNIGINKNILEVPKTKETLTLKYRYGLFSTAISHFYNVNIANRYNIFTSPSLVSQISMYWN